MTTIFSCPVCGAALPRAGDSYRCSNAHPFDIAREGYVNLLLPQHRRSKDPGYSKEMIAGRRDFFDAGHYEPLADAIAEQVLRYLPDGGTVLDAGCGEGYYLRRLRMRLADDATVLCGLDISKHGIRVAARRDPLGLYAVAGTFRMPILAGSVDVVLTHFSPVSADDFRRVVRPGGVVLVGGPGEDHLYGLKRLLYDTPERHSPVDSLGPLDGFERVDSLSIRYPLRLRGSDQVANLLLMTPYYWSVDRERLAGVDALDTEVDVVVHAYRHSRHS